MKLDPNMEIDRLLRRHARQGPGASLSFAGGEREGDGGAPVEPEGFTHLDADEMNAYAENALPARTRARYADHLADCDSCRKLVTELVLSSGIAAQLEKEAAPLALASTAVAAPGRSWRDWFASLFAPARLRYAATILAVVGIAAIALMVFRGGKKPLRFETSESQQSPSAPNVQPDGNTGAAPAPARSEGGNPESPVSNAAPTPSGSQPAGQLMQEPDAPATLSKQQPLSAPKEMDENAQQGPANNPAPPPAVNDNVVESRGELRDQDKEDVKQPALSAPADDTAKAKKQTEGGDASSEVTGLTSARAENERQKSGRAAGARENKTPFGKSVSTDSVASSKTRRSQEEQRKDTAPSAGAAMDERAATREDRSASKTEEKRSVGGRQFVRRGGAWTDTSYRGQATTNVRRGSDQYRALIADEPGLRAIADQLGGEVIIVWNSRAYRIR